MSFLLKLSITLRMAAPMTLTTMVDDHFIVFRLNQKNDDFFNSEEVNRERGHYQ
jgi:hypothetical protein